MSVYQTHITRRRSLHCEIYTVLDSLLKNDQYLFEYDIHEQAFSHRMALYLDELFSEYNVDCEWNKEFDVVKKINVDDLLEAINKNIREKIEEDEKKGIDKYKIKIVKIQEFLKKQQTGTEYIDTEGNRYINLSVYNDLYDVPQSKKQIRLKKIRPDIIVHHRGTMDNLMVIEVKKKHNCIGQARIDYENAREFDLIKLYALTSQSPFTYKKAYFIELPMDKRWGKIEIKANPFIKDIFGLNKCNVYEIKFK